MAANAADYFLKATPVFSTTIAAGGVAGAGTTSIPLDSVSGLPTDTGIELVINRIDAGTGAATNNYETVRGIISGSSLINAVRGVEGTAQAWASGKVVEFLITADSQNRMVTGILVGHNQDGTHIASLPLTTPKVTTSINDANGNEVIKTPATSSAVNEITVTNAATGNAPLISATGGDTNIELKLASKGTGKINMSTGHYQPSQTYTPSAGATATLDLSLSNWHNITMPAGNITIALSNAQVDQNFAIAITQDPVGSRTVTWFSTIKWAGGSAPTLTATANKRDIIFVHVTGSGTYDATVAMANV